MPWAHGIDQRRRIQGMGAALLPRSGQADEDHGPQVKARLDQALSGRQHLRGRHPFVDRPEHRVAAALHPQVEPHQARLPQGGQFPIRFRQGTARSCIGVDPLQPREAAVQALQHRQQVRRHGNRIPIAEEDPLHAAVISPGQGDIRKDLRQRAHMIALVPIHAAEGAAVVGAAHGDLQQIASVFSGRAVDAALVPHRTSSDRASYRASISAWVPTLTRRWFRMRG